jgi:hypothetical protein
MPRKSAAALAIAPLAPRPHPEPPPELMAQEADIWRTIVRSRPADYFDGACEALLVQYCRHVATANVLAAAINRLHPQDLKDFKIYARLLVMSARESNAIMALSAKLRLAPQHVRRAEQVVPKIGRRIPWEPVT